MVDLKTLWDMYNSFCVKYPGTSPILTTIFICLLAIVIYTTLSNKINSWLFSTYDKIKIFEDKTKTSILTEATNYIDRRLNYIEKGIMEIKDIQSKFMVEDTKLDEIITKIDSKLKNECVTRKEIIDIIKGVQ